jgi:hypothetical protein
MTHPKGISPGGLAEPFRLLRALADGSERLTKG